jgi:hypothetical protein
MKRKAMQRTIWICALGVTLMIGANAWAGAPVKTIEQSTPAWEIPFWALPILQTDWRAGMTSYGPIFWLLSSWRSSYDAATASGFNSIGGGKGGWSRICGGEEGFDIFHGR